MNLNISNQLNYNLYTNQERAQQVLDLFTADKIQLTKDHFNEVSTQHELETIANFILYGKDPTLKKNFCQRKEIQIKRAHSSYEKKEPESLDALLEAISTNEAEFMPLSLKLNFKKPKPTIDREQDAAIPGMADLWRVIDKLAVEVAALKEKKQLGLEFYRKNHLLIALRRQQFTLKDSARREVHALGYHVPAPKPASLCAETGYCRDYQEELEYSSFLEKYYSYSPLLAALAKNSRKRAEKMLAQGITWDWVTVSENCVDLRDPAHLYHFIENYSSLKESSYEDLGADAKFLLWEFENIVERANLDPVRFCILIGKIDKRTNGQIAEEVYSKFGKTYADNYISTILTHNVCGRLAEVAQEMEDEFIYRNDESKFKVCACCGHRYLKDTRNFIRKAGAPDGLASHCKKCDKKKREARHRR